MKRNNRNCIEYTESKTRNERQTHNYYLPIVVLDERKEGGIAVSRSKSKEQNKEMNQILMMQMKQRQHV